MTEDLFGLDPNEIDPDGMKYFEQYGLPDPENIDPQLLREHKKNSRAKAYSSPKNSLTDVFICLVLVLVAAPLAYVSVMAVVHFGWIGLIVGLVFSPLFVVAGMSVAYLFI